MVKNNEIILKKFKTSRCKTKVSHEVNLEI